MYQQKEMTSSTVGGVYHQMPQSAPTLQGGVSPFSSIGAAGTMSDRPVHLPAYSYVPQAMSSFAHNNQQQLLSSFSSTSQHLSMPPAFTGSQTDSFGFNQNDFVQQVVTMSAIKELQHEDEPLSSSSVVEEAPAVDHDAVAVETEAAAVVLNESVCSDAAACTRTELSAVRVAAGWESAENNENIQLNDSASAAALAVKTSAAAVDSAVVTNEHSPSHTPRNNATSNDSKQQNTPTVRRPGCFGGLCGGSSRRQPTPANRF